jgi:dipeptidyl aminopeptidase/acylaminoacyl peptidase
MARSYPWNRPDIFVERSPLFKADRIHTPLLLTHGTGDTNVPSGESDQMFTALRVLRKDVVYVRFPGQEHGIGGTQAIRVAHNEIRLAWFDKYLKGQPESWEARWEKK